MIAAKVDVAGRRFSVPTGRDADGRRCRAAPIVSQRKGALATALFALALASPAAAHVPWFNDGSPDRDEPFRLRSEMEISQIVYAGLTAPDQVDYYAFSAPPRFELQMYLVTSEAPACAEFRPAFALIGPGLNTSPKMATPVALPAELGLVAETTPAAGGGAVVVAGDTWGTLYERFAGITFVTGPRLELRLAGGEYLVAVFDPAGGAGTYGLTVDGAEEFPDDFDPTAMVALFEPWLGCDPAALAGAAATLDRD